MSLSHNLKTLRRGVNWTQRQTAKNLGITLCRYQSYEESRAEPNICLLIKIAGTYNIKVDQLISSDFHLQVAESKKGKKAKEVAGGEAK